MIDSPDKPISVYKTILDWSSVLQDWQRDTLRRIVGSGDLTAKDLDEIETLCLIENKLEIQTKESPTAAALASEHITEAESGDTATSLISLSGCKNVNALADDQKLEFGASPGLTVIYGNNGSGKSGYARVLKKACRARGQKPSIKANVYKAPTGDPASALIRYAHNGT